MNDDPRALVATGCRLLGAEGHGDLIWGHVSARDPDGRGVWMKASAWGFEEVDASRVLLVAPDGAVSAWDGRRHVEYPIHTEIMTARPDIGAVAHTHAPHAVALAAAGQPVPRFEETSDLILTADLGPRVAATLGDHRALFLVNHGIVVVGPDLPTAVMNDLFLERACRTQLLAGAAGPELRWMDDAESLRKRDHLYDDAALRQAWDYLVRRLGAEGAA